ncbi:hypothetical protein [Herbaspirillum sp. RV1423]|uniref:hypothetical protein n=1 Tax=Herbaspirillum sp. RV1423 TaxID=1443993 RepID=UPI00054F26CA|nr:hypothetical protein [Herbaspirillum sp. RV1423]
MERQNQGPEIPPVEWQIDVLFGLIEAQQCAIEALIRTHPDPDGFEANFDMNLAAAQARLLGSDRSDLAVAALADHSAELKESLSGQSSGVGAAWSIWHALKKRLSPK